MSQLMDFGRFFDQGEDDVGSILPLFLSFSILITSISLFGRTSPGLYERQLSNSQPRLILNAA